MSLETETINVVLDRCVPWGQKRDRGGASKLKSSDSGERSWKRVVDEQNGGRPKVDRLYQMLLLPLTEEIVLFT